MKTWEMKMQQRIPGVENARDGNEAYFRMARQCEKDKCGMNQQAVAFSGTQIRLWLTIVRVYKLYLLTYLNDIFRDNSVTG